MKIAIIILIIMLSILSLSMLLCNNDVCDVWPIRIVKSNCIYGDNVSIYQEWILLDIVWSWNIICNVTDWIWRIDNRVR